MRKRMQARGAADGMEIIEDSTKLKGLALHLNQALIPFLVARQIMTGSGGVCKSYDENGVEGNYFVLSPRAVMLRAIFSYETTSNNDSPAFPKRGFISPKGWHHADPRFLRLHMICGDTNMSQYARFLKVGVTGLVLDLLENVKLPFMELKNPIWETHQVSRDLTGKRYRMRFSNGKQLSAFDTLQTYQELIHEHLENSLDAERQEALDAFDDTISALREHNAIDLYDRFDHALKFRLMTKGVASKAEGLQSDSARHLMIKYHEIGPDGAFEKIADKWGHRKVLADEEIEMFYGTTGLAPKTRANARTRVFHWSNEMDYHIDSANWDYISVVRPPREGILGADGRVARLIRRIYMGDPRDPMEDLRLEEIL